MTEQKIAKDREYVEEIKSAMSGSVILMTNLSSVSLIALMRKYHHLPVPLSLTHTLFSPLSLTHFKLY